MEAIYLGLRTTRGIDLDNFGKMFGMDFLNTFESKIADLKKEGFLLLSDTHFALSPKGLAYHDSISAMLTSKDIRRKIKEGENLE